MNHKYQIYSMLDDIFTRRKATEITVNYGTNARGFQEIVKNKIVPKGTVVTAVREVARKYGNYTMHAYLSCNDLESHPTSRHAYILKRDIQYQPPNRRTSDSSNCFKLTFKQ